MATPYLDLITVHDPATGAVAPAAWGDQIRENFEAHEDPPICSVFNSVAQSVAVGSAVLTADTETADNDAMHSTVSNTSRITAQKAGRYLCTSTVEFAANATGERQADFLVNGTNAFVSMRVAAPAGGVAIITLTRLLVLAVNDYVEVRAAQNSGGNLNITLREFTATKQTRA